MPPKIWRYKVDLNVQPSTCLLSSIAIKSSFRSCKQLENNRSTDWLIKKVKPWINFNQELRNPEEQLNWIVKLHKRRTKNRNDDVTGCGKPARPGFHFKRSVLIAMACCIFSQSGLAVDVVGDGRMLCRFLATQQSASAAGGGRDPSLAAGTGTERCVVVVVGVVLVGGFAKPAGGAVMTYSINLSDCARVPGLGQVVEIRVKCFEQLR